MDPVHLAAMAELRRMEFGEVYRDDERIILRNVKRDITEQITWADLGPGAVRAVRRRMRQQTANKRNAAAVRQRQAAQRRITAERTAGAKVYDLAAAQRRQRDAAEEAECRNFRFFDRIMRSVPGQDR